MKTAVRSRITLSIATFLVLLVALSSMVQASPVVSAGWDPESTHEGAVRYRNFANANGGEIYLGVTGLGDYPNRVEKDFYRGEDIYGNKPYGSWLIDAANEITFVYDAANDRLITDVKCSHEYQLIYENFSANMGNPQYINSLNYMQIEVVSRQAGATVALTDVYLDGEYLGDFVGSGWSNWQVTNIDLSSGFTLTGNVMLTGAQPSSAEKNKVEIKFGHVPEPATMVLLGLGGLLLGRRR